jgi:Ca2+-transporting ATPase
MGNDVKYFTLTVEETVNKLETDSDKGLSDVEVEKRKSKYGLNKLAEGKRKSFMMMFFAQFKDFMILVLLIAAAISGVIGEPIDSMIIVAIVIVNAIIGAVQENRAEESLAALKKLTIPEAKVIRNGDKQIIKSVELVPGDIVMLDAGDYIPADGRLIESASLKVQESALTGESVPVTKNIKVIEDSKTPLGDRLNVVAMSSMVTNGRASMIVTKTGMNTEIGKIAGMIQNTEVTLTPLQKKLEELGKILGIGAILACVTIFIIGMVQGGDPLLLFMTAVSLAVAAIPEGLPAIVTVVLALGVQRLIKKHAIIRKLPAVETLGCAGVICSDKTGTLTQNKMTILKVFNDGVLKDVTELENRELTKAESMMNQIALLCNDANISLIEGKEQEIGDPTEVAMVRYAQSFGIMKEEEMIAFPRMKELPFDSDRKLMTTVHVRNGETKYYSLTKGAPDVILDKCTYYMKNDEIIPLDKVQKDYIRKNNDELSDNAYRVIGYGYKEVPQTTDVTTEVLESNLVFVGLTGMIDPPREEVKQSIQECQEAGIQPVMITGDHKNTAVAIARELQIYQDGNLALSGIELDELSDEELRDKVELCSVYARVSPEHKVRIVSAWQEKGKVVAMTGDGVNDAPALKKADIGCAMGITGTDVSKEAAEMILTDDNFSTIVSAVKEGRNIFENIKKSIHFLLSCNVAEIIILFTATVLGWAQPLLPIHILWINLVTDSLPALALGVDPISGDLMKNKPRNPDESLFAHGFGGRIIYQGIILSVISLSVFYFSEMYYGIEIARTMCFAVLTTSQLTHLFNVRSELRSVFASYTFTNKYLWGAAGISLVLGLAVLLIPGLQGIFDVVPLTAFQWGIVAAGAVAPLVAVEIVKFAGKIVRKIRGTK